MNVMALLLAALAQDGYTVSNPDPNTTLVNQSADKVVINWQNFNIPQGYLMKFVQPGSTSIALNRVMGQDPSLILGSLEANGRVFLLNPNGILFGSTAQVNVGGLVASTLSITDQDFFAGNYRFFQDPSKPLSYVVNQGTLSAAEFAVLAGPVVENSGSILSPSGRVFMLGSSEVFLDLTGDGLIGYSIGTATGGTVIMRANGLSDVMRAVVNTSGVVEAGAVVDRGDGTFELRGAEGIVVNRGVISVSGGSGIVALHSAKGTITSLRSTIDASGVGENSNGGKILILSENDTFFDGYAYAKGGTSGDGGFIEVSGASRLHFQGFADASATAGAAGLLFIDPEQLVIQNGGAAPNDAEVTGDGTILSAEGGAVTWTISENALEGIAGGTDITLESTNRLEMLDLADNVLALQTTGLVTFRVVGPTSGAFTNDIAWNAGDTIQTQGADVLMETADDIGFGVNAATPAGSIRTNGGDVTIRTIGVNTLAHINLNDIDTTSGGPSGTVLIEAYETATVRTINAPGTDLRITADLDDSGVGGIRQNVGGVWTANRLILNACDGMKRTDNTAIVTNVNFLQATNDTDINNFLNNGTWASDRILISNQGPLTLEDIDLLGWAVRNNALVSIFNPQIPASVEITSNGNLTLNASVIVISNLCPITLTANNGSIVDDGDQTTMITGEVLLVPGAGTSTGLTTITLNASVDVGAAPLDEYVDVGLFGQLNVNAGTNAYVTHVGAALPLDISTSSIGTFGSTGAGTLAFVNLVGNLTVNSNVFANHNDEIILGAVGDLTVSTGTVSTTGSRIFLWATNDVLQTGGTISTANRVEIEADSDEDTVTPTALDGFGLINKTAGTLNAGDLVASAAEGINFNSFNATRFQATNSTSGDITATDTNTLNLADIDTLGYSISNVLTGNITISTSAGDLTLSGDVLTASGDITLTAARHLLDDGDQGTEISTTGDITLTANTGSIGTYNGVNFSGFVDFAPGFNTLTATATGGGAGNGNVLVSQVGVLASLDTTAGNVVLTPNANGTLGLVNYAGDLTIGAAINRAGGIILGGNGVLDVGFAITSSASFIVLASTDDVDVNEDVTAATRVTIEADSSKFEPDIAANGVGAVTQSGGNTITGVEAVFSAGSGITVLDLTAASLQVTNTTTGDIDITESDGVILADITGLGWAVNNLGAGNITIVTTLGNLTLNGDVLAAGGDITLTADGSIVDDGIQTTEISTIGAISLTATTGSIGTFGGTNFNGFVDVEAGFSSLTLTAAAGNVYVMQVGAGALLFSDITLGGGTPGAGMDLGIVNNGGDFTIDAPVAIGGNIIFGASGNLSVAFPIATTATSIILAADGDVTGAGDVSVAAGRLTVEADSARFTPDGAGLINLTGTLTATELVASAATGITLSGIAAASAVQARSSTSGAVNLTSAGSMTLASITGGAAVSTPGTITVVSGGTLTLTGGVSGGGNVTITAAVDFVQIPGADVSSGGNISVTSTSGDQFLSLLSAAGTITLVAGGSIFDINDTGSPRLNLLSGGDATLTAGGTIGVPNCLEVDIGGFLMATAGGSVGGESICFVGRARGGFSGTGPGNVEFTQIFAVPDFEPKRPDPIIQVPLLDKNIWPPRLIELQLKKKNIPTRKK